MATSGRGRAWATSAEMKHPARAVRALIAAAPAAISFPGECLARDSSSSLALSVDLDLAAGFDAADVPEGEEVADEDVSRGSGFGVRLGWERDLLAVLYARPELGVHRYDFGDGGPAFLQSSAGLRFGVEFLLRLGVFAHVGVAHVEDPAVMYDTGVQLGLGLIPGLDLGLHLAFEYVNPRGEAEFDFVKFGLHAGLEL